MSDFAKFIRYATPQEKATVYRRVMDEVMREQEKVMREQEKVMREQEKVK